MKHTKISFIDFLYGFDYKMMNFYRIFCEKYDIEVLDM